ncbi:putative clathrin assembly protein [Camellia lanceoleosa]|uniref:Clathrin assembly protein n=1 Tax=Camellia lanceoleosa TaxID=1840588 RepID=A0ACC0I7P8_9ERIC|nr:putative clathrin assembly protein [Camellia lanceoleosa]
MGLTRKAGCCIFKWPCESEYEETSEEPKQAAPEESEQQEVEDKETLVDTQQDPEHEPEPKEEEVPPLISTDQTEDLLGLNEINPKAVELEQSNALALAIVPPGNNPVSSNWDLSAIRRFCS